MVLEEGDFNKLSDQQLSLQRRDGRTFQRHLGKPLEIS